MKKIIACIFAVSVISTAAFSKNFFSQRYFEIKYGTDVDFSSNLFALNDIMKKDLVIDLRKIADDCPEDGFNIRSDISPRVEVNLNIKDFHLGFSSGVEMYESIVIGKDVFDFLGYGNSIGETMDFTFDNDTDVFAYSQIDVGFKVGKFKFKVQPAVFKPVISVRGGGGSMSVLNSTEGNLEVDMDLDLDIYSMVPLKSNGDAVEVDEDKIGSAFAGGYGFDFGGDVSYALSKSLSLGTNFRVPVIPGHLLNRSNIQAGFEYDVQFKDFKNAEKTSKDTTVKNEEANLAINRPLKWSLYLDKDILGTLFNARASGGFGIRRPFCDEAVIYPEYYFGFTLNLINVFKIGVSTQYTDQLFIHQLGTTLNVRIIQLDLGISTQSSSFKKSMSVAGIGAYAYVTMGF